MGVSGILFITRKTDGIGGMQQLNRDLWGAFRHLYGSRARCVKPVGMHDVVLFPVRAIAMGVIAAKRGATVHVGDCALAPIGFLVRQICPQARLTITTCGLDVVWPRWWYQWLIRTSLPCFDCIVCISEATASEMRKRGIDPEKVVVIPCGIWPFNNLNERKPESLPATRPSASSRRRPFGHELRAEWALDAEASSGPRGYPLPAHPRLLSIGRLIKRKGIAWFVREVLPQLLQEFPTLHYTIIGDGPERIAIESAVEELQLNGHVTLLGSVGDAAKEQHLNEADVFVMPNVTVKGDMEGFGIACIEASSRGVPVAAACIEGLQDAVRGGETGMFFEQGSAEDAARVVSQMLRRPMDRATVAESTLKHFNWETFAKRYRDEVFSEGIAMEPKRIGLVTWDYDPPKGGLGRAMQEIVGVLQSRGEQVEVLTPERSIASLQSSPYNVIWTGSSLWQDSPSKFLFSLRLWSRLEGWVQSQLIDRLLLPTGPGGLFLFRKPKRCSLVVISYHTYWQQSHLVPGEWWKRVFIPLERRTLRLADRVLCYSEDTRGVLFEHYDIEPDRIDLLPQIFNVDYWSVFPARDNQLPATSYQQPVCLCIARLDRRKGILELLSAWSRVQSQLPEARLILVGRGTLEQAVDAFISEHQLSVQRIFILSDEELASLVRRADLVMCPSYLEGFGLTAAEAMAAGTAVVASDTDGLRGLIENNVSGILVPPGDVDAWAKATLQLLRNPDRREQLSLRAKQSIRERFDQSRATQALHASLKTL